MEMEDLSCIKLMKERQAECLELLQHWNKRHPMSYEELQQFAAAQMAHSSELSNEFDELAARYSEMEQCLSIFANNTGRLSMEVRDNLLAMFAEGKVMAAKDLLAGSKAARSGLGKKGANARHNAIGGSREKAAKIRMIWASGNYSSRDLCAEQECAALGMSFSAARKALRGTADPINLHLVATRKG